jgi:hypothetical protein
MYTSAHHQLVMAGVEAVWEHCGRQVLDLAILSGGYGLLRAEQTIIPYDVSFDEFEEAELAEWVRRLQVRQRATDLVSDYDLIFLLLSGRYLAVLGLPLAVPDSVQQIVLTSSKSLAWVPPADNLFAVVAHGSAAARRWHVKADRVRGFLFQRLCSQVARLGPAILEWLYLHPGDTERLFYKRTRWRPQLPLW